MRNLWPVPAAASISFPIALIESYATVTFEVNPGAGAARRHDVSRETVLYEKLGRVAPLTANRPRYRNAQSRRMLEELDAAVAFKRLAIHTRVVPLIGKNHVVW